MNWFFFLYVALFALSIWALVLALMSLDVEGLAARRLLPAVARFRNDWPGAIDRQARIQRQGTQVYVLGHGR